MKFDPYNWLRCKYGPDQPYGFEFGAEPDYVNALGRWRPFYPKIREADRFHVDPPIKNSRASYVEGTDTHFYPSAIANYRYMGMPVDEWRYKVLYRKNPLIKNIYDKWDISDEHPGMQMRTSYRMPLQPPEKLGYVFPYFANLKKALSPLGNYFDAPAGEQCFTKSLCSAKLMAMIMVPLWLNDVTMYTFPVGWRNMAKRFFMMSTFPTVAAWSYGATACLVSSYRGTDDLINVLWGVLAATSVMGMARGHISAFRCFGVALPVTFVFRIWQDADEGPMIQDAYTYGYHALNYRTPLVPKIRPMPPMNF